MTVQQARKILGEYAKRLSDNDIQGIIESFNSLIEVGFRQFERTQQVRIDTNQYDIDKTNRL